MRYPLHKLFASVVLAVAIFSLAPAPASAQGVTVYVDGQRLAFDQPPVMQGGRTLVPLRGIFEALGATVVWDAPTRTVRAQRDTTSIELALGSTIARVNGQAVTLDVPAQSIGGRTMVPLRFIGEALGAEVEWQAATRTVRITSGGAEPGPGPSPSTGAPAINQVVVSPQRPLNLGDTLTVIMTGDPGGQASFDIVGVRTGVPMPEVSSGRYQGTLVVGSGLQANAAALVVRLVRNGRETVQQASTTVTIGTTTGGPVTGQITEFPAPNAVVADRRPSVGATFPSPISAGNIRLLVDGRDFTNEAQISGNQLTWRPTYDLSLGQHTVRVTGNDNFGNSLDRQWSFTIGQAGQATRFPGTGATVDTRRPTIGMTFPQAVRTETARIWVDGQEFTNQARITPYEISWIPTYDLALGTHNVRVDGTTTAGQFLNEVWSFTIGGTGGQSGGNATGLVNSVSLNPDPPYSTGQAATVTMYGAPGGSAWFDVGGRTGFPMTEISSGVYRGTYTVASQDASTRMVVSLRMPDGRVQTVQSSDVVNVNQGGANPLQLTVTSPADGQGVPGNFNIVGRATPNATVEVVAQERQSLIPGVISIGGRTVTGSGQADANGNFNVAVGATAVPAGATMDVRVTARDVYGNTTAPVQFQVRRQ